MAGHRSSDQTAPPRAVYQYKYLVFEGDAVDIVDPINDLGAQGWRVHSFDISGGVHRILLELVS
jgi:hypothetical protein